MKKIVLWDFDGVLADTLAECYEITSGTIEKNKRRIADELNAPLSPYAFEEFAGDRPHCVNAADFFAHYLSRRKYGSAVEEELENARKNYRDLIVFLDGEYYLQRASMARRLGEEYFEVMKPYPGILASLKSIHSAGVRQAVMTARDRQSASGWLKHYGVEDCFNLVVGTEVSRADRHVKKKQIAALRSSFRQGEYFFVDDIAHDLQVVNAADPRIRLIFAAWGYGKKAPAGTSVAKTPQDVVSIAAPKG